MNGYEFVLRQPVYHDDEFSHNVTKHKTVHALTEHGACAQVDAELESQSETILGSGIVIRAEKQYVASCRRLGRVRYRTVVEYEEEP